MDHMDYESDSPDDTASSSEDEDAAQERINRHRARREQRHLENLYGSFLDEDETDEYVPGSLKKRQRRGLFKDRSSSQTNPSTVPVFVKTSRPDEPERPTERVRKVPTQTQQPLQKKVEADKETDEEELERRRIMEEKNQRFLELLQKGKGFKTGKTTNVRSEPAPKRYTTSGKPMPDKEKTSSLPAGFTAVSTGGLGLGAHSRDMPQQFGAGSQRPTTKPTPKLASWEKYTKGIGSKLLAKMGYSGQGGLSKIVRKAPPDEPDDQAAQATEQVVEVKGIAQPIQVKVRPSGLGLGFGNFREASSLKENKQIEAQVRGIANAEDEEQGGDHEQLSFPMRSGLSSSLPSVKDLLKEQSWRRDTSKKRKRKQQTVVPFTELLQKHTDRQVIIDMRGPSLDDLGEEMPSGEDSIGIELLHNVSLLLNAYENKIYTSSAFVESTNSKLASIESDVANMTERHRATQDRIDKLQRTRVILEQVKELVGSNTTNTDTGLQDLKGLMSRLAETFTEQEKVDLKFSTVLLPAMLSSFVEAKMISEWKPLEDSLDRSKVVIHGILSAAQTPDKVNDFQALLALTTNNLLPKIKSALVSRRWNPIRDIDPALDLYELLVQELTASKKSFQASMDRTGGSGVFEGYDESDEPLQLVTMAQETLVRNVIYNKLLDALGHWKPELGRDDRIKDRIDYWIIPWLPHIDHEGLLPPLIAECRRKVRNCISILKRVKDDEQFVFAVLETLRPWLGVLKEATLQDIVSTDVSPRIAAHLHSMEIHVDAAKLDSNFLKLLYQLNELRLLPDSEFLALIEAELLYPWCAAIHNLLPRDPSIESVVRCYVHMKSHLFGSWALSPPCPMARRLLQDDDMLCRILYTVILMVHYASGSKMEKYIPLKPGKTSFRTVLSRRKKEERRRTADEFVKSEAGGQSDPLMTARLRLHRSGLTPTFREIVEEYASEHSIDFRPKAGSTDGKPVYLFGNATIHFDKDVIFVLRRGEWEPTSLVGLAEFAR